jgi:hypothetical protein
MHPFQPILVPLDFTEKNRAGAARRAAPIPALRGIIAASQPA